MRAKALLVVCFLMVPTLAYANFVAYVDLAGLPTDSNQPNVVKFLEPIGGSRVLKDYSSGANTSVTLTMTGSTTPAAYLDGTTGSKSYTAGTDAYNVFNGIVDYPSPINTFNIQSGARLPIRPQTAITFFF